ncbi:MAG: MlaD family protein [Candidatus Cyclobacteriaceae bacterium M3_2C_046]
MNEKVKNNIKLGLFVSIGLVILVVLIYYLGSKQNLFGSSTRIYAVFQNVSGLKVGNNVRFAGINVGTVERIKIISDSTVSVAMLIESSASDFIKENSDVSVGSEGLMGNKIVTIAGGTTAAVPIDDGDTLDAVEPIEIEDVLRTIQETGLNAREITQDLSQVSQMIKQGEGLVGNLLADSSLDEKFERMITMLENTGNNARMITQDIAVMTQEVKEGQGTLGQLIQNDSLITKVRDMVDSLEMASQNAVQITQGLNKFTDKLNNSEGTLGRFLTDTTMARDVNQTINNVNDAAAELDITAEKINNSWLLNGLFGGSRDKDKNKK